MSCEANGRGCRGVFSGIYPSRAHSKKKYDSSRFSNTVMVVLFEGED